MDDVIFQPLTFRNLTVKNRIFRSNISGRFDNYDGSGNQARVNWELKFARGGVGAIISSFVPVAIRDGYFRITQLSIAMNGSRSGASSAGESMSMTVNSSCSLVTADVSVTSLVSKNPRTSARRTGPTRFTDSRAGE